jgi:hypothetical protein
MALRRGYITALEYGESPTTTATVGKVMSGGMDFDSNSDFVFSIGGVADSQDGIVNVTGSANILVTSDSTAFLAHALRSSPTANSLTELVFIGGTSSEAYKHDGAKINSVRLSCSVGQSLQAEIGWLAKTPSEIAVPTYKAYDTGTVYQWFQGACTIEDGAYSMRSFTVELGNNCTAESSLDSKSTNVKRHPEEILEGNEIVTGSFTFGVPLSSGIIDDTWLDTRSFTYTASLAFTNSVNTLTITVDNMAINTHRMPFAPAADIIVYEASFQCKPNDASALTIGTA